MAKNKVGKTGKRNRNAGSHPSYKKRKMTPAQIRKKRKYDSEYQKKRVSDRVKRNKARRAAEKKGKVRKGDGKDVHHVGGIKSNKTKVISRSKNRALKKKR